MPPVTSPRPRHVPRSCPNLPVYRCPSAKFDCNPPPGGYSHGCVHPLIAGLKAEGSHMVTSLLKPKVDLASLVMRWGLAAIFLVHGYFKLVQNLPLRPEWSMTEQMVIGWAEMIIGAAMAIGLLSRIAALAGIAHQVAIIVTITGRLALAG